MLKQELGTAKEESLVQKLSLDQEVDRQKLSADRAHRECKWHQSECKLLEVCRLLIR